MNLHLFVATQSHIIKSLKDKILQLLIKVSKSDTYKSCHDIVGPTYVHYFIYMSPFCEETLNADMVLQKKDNIYL